MRSLLFVDDEPRVLEAMQRCLRSYKNVWDITYATSGRDALALVRARRLDAIVTDMRMPEMDGVELLKHVYREQPTTMRIVLSGQTEITAAMESVALAHRFLGKPCSPASVMEAVNAMHASVRALEDDDARDALVALSSLPSSPRALEQLDAALASDDTLALAAIIASDIGMSAKVLQVAQSSFFGGRARHSNAVEAVHVLGAPVVRELRKHAFECRTWRGVHDALPSDAPFRHRVGALVSTIAEGASRVPPDRLGAALSELWGFTPGPS